MVKVLGQEVVFSRDTREMVLAVLESWMLVLAPHQEVKGVKEKLREVNNLRMRLRMEA